MKKHFLPLFGLFLLLPALAACGKYDYTVHISDERSDIFCAETETYTLTVSCVSREYPYLCDGVAAQKSDLLEAVLREKTPTGGEYELYFTGEKVTGGEMSFRSVTGDYFYSRSAERFPEGSLPLTVVKDGVSEDLVLTSVRTENTLTVHEALAKAVEAERETVEKMTVGGQFCGEFHVRLLRRDKNYYYVGFVDKQGNILALLLDSETGEPLARRQSP